ncbi:MAG: hypothetical protein DWC05_00095 [Candidatus Poseidoniales archaeon]|nr:MAG: hypothetical protein DWC05_00095 [Candidatus Poseidoniales archaeon]
MVEGHPIVWVKKKPGAYRTVADEQGIRLEPSGSPVLRVMASIFVLSLAYSSAMFSVGLLQDGGESEMESPGVTGCWEYQTEILLGANPTYCFDGTYSAAIELKTSEDQHIRESGEDQEYGGTYVSEYRWEDVDDSVVYGFVSEERYNCYRYIPEFVLADNWVVEDFADDFEYPDWCGSAVENQDSRVYEEGAHPYDDVWMYAAHDVGAMTTFLDAHKTTEDRTYHRHYVAKSFVEWERAEWGAEGDFPSEMVICSVPLTLVLLFAADTRRRVFVVDRGAKSIIRKRRGPFPSFSKTWSDVDFSATTVVRSVREKQHSTAATEDSPAEHWTTNHPGLNIVIRYGQHQQVLLFFEDGGNVNVHAQVISDFMAAIGLEFQAVRISNPDAELYARPTLQYLAESNGVSKWDDHTANFIITWYYESDPNFIEKYPQFEEDPEFMLEPHGDRPFKAMYIRPLYEGAGLTTVRSTEEAQRLLDHLLALRDEETKEKEKENHAEKAAEGGAVDEIEPSEYPASMNNGGPWGYGPTEEETAQSTVSKDDESTESPPMDSFWTRDDSGNEDAE